MAIDFTVDAFPNKALTIIAARMELIDASVNVELRPLRPADPNFSIGIYPTGWTPVPNTIEMRGVDFARDSTIQQYGVVVQCMIKDAKEERGLASHSVFSEIVRTILATDAPLRSQLGGLTATLDDSTKILKRWWIRSGRYISGSLQGNNLYLASNDLILEVEKAS